MGPNKKTARIAGLLYLAIIIGSVVSGILSEMYVRSSLVLPGGAAASVNSPVASEWVYRIGFAGYLVVYLSDLALAGILYVLLRPVNRNLALLAAFLRAAEAVILGINLLNHFAAFTLLSSAGYLTLVEPGQLQALAQSFLEAHRSGYLVGQVFFGFHCLVLGYLLFRSGYVPRPLGILFVFASCAYLAESSAFFLAPNYQAIEGVISWIVGVSAFVTEIWFTLWLLFKGVRIEGRHNRAPVPLQI